MTNEEIAALLTKLDGEATPGPVKVVLIGYQPEPRLVDSTEKLLAIFGNAEDPREVFDEWNGNAELFATYRNHHAQIVAGLAALGAIGADLDHQEQRDCGPLSWLKSAIDELRARGPDRDCDDSDAFWEMVTHVELLRLNLLAALQPAKETP